MSKRCEEEKLKFLEAYNCYDWEARDSLAEIIHFIPESDFPAYDETPKNAVIFARTGMDGCHYCMVEDGNKINIYYVEPGWVDVDRVFLIGHSISEVLSYGLAIGGLLFCQIFDMEKDEFLKEMNKAKCELEAEFNSERFTTDLNALKREFPIIAYSASEVYDKLRSINCSK